MQVITWNKSFRGVPNGEGMKDNFDPDDYETHATILDKLLAWEKKLYEEVKVHSILHFFSVFFCYFTLFLFVFVTLKSHYSPSSIQVSTPLTLFHCMRKKKKNTLVVFMLRIETSF